MNKPDAMERRSRIGRFMLPTFCSLLSFLSLTAIPSGGAEKTKKAAQKVATQSVRTIDFPKNSIGSLSTFRYKEAFGLEDQQPVSAAAGLVKASVPTGRWLQLEVNRRLFETPGFLDSLPAQAFDGFKIGFMSMDDSEGSMCDSVIAHITHFPNLKFLQLDRSDSSDKGLLCLKSLPELKLLNAAMSGVRGTFLQHAQNFPNLEVLTLFNCQLDSNAFSNLPKLTKLLYIDIHHTDLNEIAMQYIGKCTKLRVLRMSENPKIGDQGLQYLSGLKDLSRLEIQQTAITLNGLKLLQPLAPHLTYLKLSQKGYSKKDMQMVHQMFPHAGLEFVARDKSVDENTNAMYAPLHY